MEPFNEAELAFLGTVRSPARIATVGHDGTPQVTPVGWALSTDRTAIEIDGADKPSTFAGIDRVGRAALVIDDGDSPQPRGIEVRGTADAPAGPNEAVRLVPERVIAWGFEGAGGDRHVKPVAEDTDARPDGEQAAPGPMQAVVRRSVYDPEALAAAGAQMAQFERVHAAQPGYGGTVVVDLGGGERIIVTLWDSEQHAAAARSALTPVVEALLGPLEREPSRLLGVGRVITTDLSLARDGTTPTSEGDSEQPPPAL